MIDERILFHMLFGYFMVSFSERFWHKNLWHTPMPGTNYLSSLWDYDLATHKDHHELINGHDMEDVIYNIDDYVVQKFSNVLVVAIITAILHYSIVMLVRNSFELNMFHLKWTIIATTLYFTLWYFLEDHFHTGHHFAAYRKEYFSNKSLLSKWFHYSYRYHKVHHDNPRLNYNFIFPLADWIFGTYVPPWIWEKYKCKCDKMMELRSKAIKKLSSQPKPGRKVDIQIWEKLRDIGK